MSKLKPRSAATHAPGSGNLYTVCSLKKTISKTMKMAKNGWGGKGYLTKSGILTLPVPNPDLSGRGNLDFNWTGTPRWTPRSAATHAPGSGNLYTVCSLKKTISKTMKMAKNGWGGRVKRNLETIPKATTCTQIHFSWLDMMESIKSMNFMRDVLMFSVCPKSLTCITNFLNFLHFINKCIFSFIVFNDGSFLL